MGAAGAIGLGEAFRERAQHEEPRRDKEVDAREIISVGNGIRRMAKRLDDGTSEKGGRADAETPGSQQQARCANVALPRTHCCNAPQVASIGLRRRGDGHDPLGVAAMDESHRTNQPEQRRSQVEFIREGVRRVPALECQGAVATVCDRSEDQERGADLLVGSDMTRLPSTPWRSLSCNRQPPLELSCELLLLSPLQG